jgi:glyoxylase-like metal-dependent hydrolase (beta-lactamase superfamily II)
MKIQTFYDEYTSTLTYVVFDDETHDAIVIDPVLDYRPESSTTSYVAVDEVTEFLQEHALKLHYVLETHAHADHLSGSQVLKARFPGAQVAIGARITEVQRVFKNVFDLPDDFPTDGRQFDRLLADNERLTAGALSIEVRFTPGHTPACACYVVGDAVFTGDTLFMPDMGTGRCDFPGGSADAMFDSVTTRLYTLPDTTRVFVGHDYQPGGRALAFESTIAAEKRHNIQLPAGRSADDYIAYRKQRDATLDAPRLLFQSVQVNVNAGTLPEPAANELRYLKIPINAFRPPPDPRAGLTEDTVR